MSVINYGLLTNLLSVSASLEKQHQKEWKELLSDFLPGKSITFRGEVAVHDVDVGLFPVNAPKIEGEGVFYLSFRPHASGLHLMSGFVKNVGVSEFLNK